MHRLLFPSIVHLRTIRTTTLSRLPLPFHRPSTLSAAMSRQTTLSFTSQSASSAAPVPAPAASSSPPPTSAQPQLARTSSKRKNCIESGLDELCQLFGNGVESDDSATAAAAESASAAAAPASSVSSASAPSSSPSVPLSRAAIRAVFNSCEHDLQRAIDALSDRTGRHTDKHSNFTFSSGSGSSGSSVGSDVKKQRVGRLQLVEQRGDLFSCASSVALAHCVSVDLAMGKGIAVAFKTKFGGVADLKSQKKQIGEVAVLKHNGRFVYYLVRSFTRPHSKRQRCQRASVAVERLRPEVELSP